MRCYLENIGILNANDEVDKDRAVEMLWSNSATTIDDCLPEMQGSACQRIYFLAKCVMTRAIVDGRTGTDEH